VLGRQLTRGIDNMTEQRFAGEGMQHLGQIGVHPFALACGQNHDLEAHGENYRMALCVMRLRFTNKKGSRSCPF
jgi:hypothetical protein